MLATTLGEGEAGFWKMRAASAVSKLERLSVAGRASLEKTAPLLSRSVRLTLAGVNPFTGGPVAELATVEYWSGKPSITSTESPLPPPAALAV